MEQQSADGMRQGMSRRAFMASAAVSALGLYGLQTSPSHAQVKRMPYSVSTVMYKGLSMPQILEQIAKTGCEAVDIWGGQWIDHLEWVEQIGPQKLAELLEQHALKLYSFSIYLTPQRRRLEYLELLKKCGGQVAVLDSEEPNLDKTLENLKPLVEKAEQLDVKLAVENHAGQTLESIDDFARFVEQAKSPALGMALAPYHVMSRDESVARAVEVIGEKLFFFYAWQHAEGMHELPGDGALDFVPIIQALKKNEFPYYLNIFCHTSAPPAEMTAAVIKARQYLYNCQQQQ